MMMFPDLFVVISLVQEYCIAGNDYLVVFVKETVGVKTVRVAYEDGILSS